MPSYRIVRIQDKSDRESLKPQKSRIDNSNLIRESENPI